MTANDCQVKEKPYGEACRTTLLCVDGYDRRVPEGRLYHPAQAGGAHFFGVMDLLLKVEALADDLQFPQSFEQLRTFAPGQVTVDWDQDPAAAAKSHGVLATFSLRLYFRQHSSWQGTLTWLDGKEEQPFRSVLELLHLMDSALAVDSIGAEGWDEAYSSRAAVGQEA